MSTLTSPALLLTYLAAFATLLGVAFAVFAFIEFRKLSRLKNDFDSIRKDLRKDLDSLQRAMQRVIASYSAIGPDQQIQLLQEAVEIDPKVFNGYNALGYAYLAASQPQSAIDAFKEAITQRPEDKAGYFDLAQAYVRAGERKLALKYLRKAVRIDPTAKQDLAANVQFEELRDESAFFDLLQ